VVQFSNLTGNPVRLVSLSLATSLPGVRVTGTSVYDERLAGSAPGRYAIPPVRITYSTAGGQGWQDQLASLTLIVSNPPLPGPRPFPRDQACPPV
jgi:hypothetical protein